MTHAKTTMAKYRQIHSQEKPLADHLDVASAQDTAAFGQVESSGLLVDK